MALPRLRTRNLSSLLLLLSVAITLVGLNLLTAPTALAFPTGHPNHPNHLDARTFQKSPSSNPSDSKGRGDDDEDGSSKGKEKGGGAVNPKGGTSGWHGDGQGASKDGKKTTTTCTSS
ncbi:hypothetical protein HK102_006106, partial [Quaeritorhiza haematococci]